MPALRAAGVPCGSRTLCPDLRSVHEYATLPRVPRRCSPRPCPRFRSNRKITQLARDSNSLVYQSLMLGCEREYLHVEAMLSRQDNGCQSLTFSIEHQACRGSITELTTVEVHSLQSSDTRRHAARHDRLRCGNPSLTTPNQNLPCARCFCGSPCWGRRAALLRGMSYQIHRLLDSRQHAICCLTCEDAEPLPCTRAGLPCSSGPRCFSWLSKTCVDNAESHSAYFIHRLRLYTAHGDCIRERDFSIQRCLCCSRRRSLSSRFHGFQARKIGVPSKGCDFWQL